MQKHPMLNPANQLTLCRILFIPLLVAVYYSPFSWRFLASGLLFTLAGITDALDGYIARKYNLTTPFGAFLDPVADKLMVAVALAILIESHNDVLFTLPAVVIICREIVISALREWMAELGKRANVAVSSLGKFKTTLQIVAIVMLLAFSREEFPRLYEIGYVALYAAAILTIWSMCIYLKAAWPSLMGRE
ncbi:MAG: CDP-diacylglycerol--glycerol-3-phosphate 3-phosphatidyltransferase [Lentisphaeria bacterium]